MLLRRAGHCLTLTTSMMWGSVMFPLYRGVNRRKRGQLILPKDTDW